MSADTGFWTPEKDAILRRALREGKPRALIAKDMGTTKNSVIGRAHRLPPLLCETRDPFPAPRTCLYPYGDPPDADFHFCGGPVNRPGSSWCAKHHGVTSVKAGEVVE